MGIETLSKLQLKHLTSLLASTLFVNVDRLFTFLIWTNIEGAIGPSFGGPNTQRTSFGATSCKQDALWNGPNIQRCFHLGEGLIYKILFLMDSAPRKLHLGQPHINKMLFGMDPASQKNFIWRRVLFTTPSFKWTKH